MSPEEQEELASLYVLGVLEGSELAAFERELVAHPELAALIAELEKASTLLAKSVPHTRLPIPCAIPSWIKSRVAVQPLRPSLDQRFPSAGCHGRSPPD